MNSSGQTSNLKDMLQNKIDDLEKQVLSRVNSLEEGKFNPKNESEERGKIESTLTSLHQRITDLEKGTGRSRPRCPRDTRASPPPPSRSPPLAVPAPVPRCPTLGGGMLNRPSRVAGAIFHPWSGPRPPAAAGRCPWAQQREPGMLRALPRAGD